MRRGKCQLPALLLVKTATLMTLSLMEIQLKLARFANYYQLQKGLVGRN